MEADADSLPPGFGGPSQAAALKSSQLAPPGFGGSLPETTSQPSQQIRPKRSKDRRVTWAANDKLFKIRLFAAEDAPAMSGAAHHQEQLQAKQTSLMYTNNPLFGSDLPPGFGAVAARPGRPDPAVLAAIVPQIPWRRPDVVHLDPQWHVMAGGVSREVQLQKQRELRVLEAVYPRPSSIPESPAEPLEPQETYDDGKTSQIPLTPLEDDDSQDAIEISSNPVASNFQPQMSVRQGTVVHMTPFKSMPLPNGFEEQGKQSSLLFPLGPGLMTSQGRSDGSWKDNPSGHLGIAFSTENTTGQTGARPTSNAKSIGGHNGVTPDVAAAAAAAFAALAKSKEIGSMIDNNLLIQILSNPNLIHSLTGKQSFAASTQVKSAVPQSSDVSSGLERFSQPGAISSDSNGGGSEWSMSSSSAAGVVAVDAAKLAGGEGYSSGVERYARKSVTEEKTQNSVSQTLGVNQLYSEQINGRVGVSSSRSPNGGALPFASNHSPLQGSHSVTSLVSSTSARPLSRYDEQYYKSLIMQHGKSGDDDQCWVGQDVKSNGARASVSYGGAEISRYRRDSDGTGMGLTLEVRSKARKTCLYFATPRGCRNGASCTFLHESAESEKSSVEKPRPEQSQVQLVKRLKVDG